MSDNPFDKLREQAAREAEQREAARQRQELLRRLNQEYNNLRYYGERAGTQDDTSHRGLAEQIPKFLAAVRDVGLWDRFEALRPHENPAWEVALDRAVRR